MHVVVGNGLYYLDPKKFIAATSFQRDPSVPRVWRRHLYYLHKNGTCLRMTETKHRPGLLAWLQGARTVIEQDVEVLDHAYRAIALIQQELGASNETTALLRKHFVEYIPS